MMKVLTIIFLIYYTITLFKGNKITLEVLEDWSIAEYNKSNITENKNKVLVLSVFLLFEILVEIIYMINATEYGNKVITVGFLGYTIIKIIRNLIKKQKKSLKEKSTKEKIEYLKKSNKSINMTLGRLVSVFYYTYMFLVLFL